MMDNFSRILILTLLLLMMSSISLRFHQSIAVACVVPVAGLMELGPSIRVSGVPTILFTIKASRLLLATKIWQSLVNLQVRAVNFKFACVTFFGDLPYQRYQRQPEWTLQYKHNAMHENLLPWRDPTGMVSMSDLTLGKTSVQFWNRGIAKIFFVKGWNQLMSYFWPPYWVRV